LANKLTGMTFNKYELRNREAQEIMAKPPHAFISRGNIAVMIILLASFYFINTFPLYERELAHFEITGIDTDTKKPDSIKLVLSLNNGISKNVKAHQAAKISVNNLNFNNAGFLHGQVDSIGHTQYNAPILYFTCSSAGLSSQKGMIGNIEIIIKKKTFFRMLLERVKM